MRDTTSSAGRSADQTEGARHQVPRQGSYGEPAGRGASRGMALGFSKVAAILMMLTGVAGFFEGLVAGLNGHFYVPRANYPLAWTVHGWGWVHIVIGVALFAAGVALLADRTWARIVGTVIASLSALANFLFIPYYPVWSIVLVALNAVIIWALVAPRAEVSYPG